MPTQSKNGARTLQSRFGRWLGTSVAIAGLFVTCQMATAQTTLSMKPATPPLQVDSAVSKQTPGDSARLSQVVKIIVDRQANQLTLVGSKEDIATITLVLKSIYERMKLNSDPMVTEKVVLQSQLAETVVTIMESSLRTHDPGGPELSISAVHFPEAILISGPASAVKRAKKLLATIDR